LADNVYTGTLTALGFVNSAVPVGAVNCALTAPPVNACATTVVDLANGAPAVPPIFWEPDNLRGRALASFDAQVANPFSLTSGIITPFDYVVGTLISRNFGAGFVNDSVTGIQYF